MIGRLSWMLFPLPLLPFTSLLNEAPSGARAAEPAQDAALEVGNDAGQTITLSVAEFGRLPRTALQVKAPHSDQMAKYEGVLLYQLLQKAGVRFADRSSPENAERKLPGPLRTSYVLIEAADGYRVVYSVAEIHPDLGGQHVLLADRRDGQPLDARTAPFQVIDAATELHGRWIRQVTRILVQPAARGTGVRESSAPPRPSLAVGNETGKTIRLTPAEFAKLPRTAIQDRVPPHKDRRASYEGVLLHELLRQAGVQFEDPTGAAKGERRVPAALRTAYVLIEAEDGNQVVFSIPEIHPDLGGRRLLVADRVDGKPLADEDRPYRIVVAGSELHEVWIRQVIRILVLSASPVAPTANSSPRPSQTGKSPQPGRVYLLGIGPGDPELITVKAAGVLKKADAVFCFSWVKDELGRFVAPERVEVVSQLLMGGRYLEQKPEAVSGELRVQAVQAHADLAKLKHRVEALVAEGKTVVFADNGDPMVFSPWSWAMQQFAQLQPVVIPGVSSFNAANAALQRGVTGSGSILLTSGDDANLTDKAGRLAGTVVFFTHQKKLEHLLPSLQARFPANTPAAVVCDVSYPNERVIRSTLGEIGKSIGQEKLPQLYLFYVGDGLQQIRCCPLTDSPAEIHPPKAG